MPLQINNLQAVQPTLSVPRAEGGALAQYQPGDTLTAVVTVADGETATLRLPDGSQLQAAIRAGQPLEAQDTLALQLSHLSEGAVSMRLLAVNGQPVTAEVPVMDFKLMQMDVSPTKANLTAASLLNRLEIPVTPQALTQFESIARHYPLLPLEQAALLAASDIPATPQNVAAFTQFIQSPVQAEAFASALRALLQPDGAQPSLHPTSASAASPAANLLSLLSPKLAAALSQGGAQTAPATQATQSTQTPQPTEAQMTQNAQNAPQSPTQQALQTPAQAAAQSAAEAQTPLPLTGNAEDARVVQNALQAIFPKLQPQESEALGKALQRAVPALSSRVAALADAAAGGDSPAAKQVTQLGSQFCQQLQFGNELGTLYYTQIPFTRREQQENAELYILKRNGARKIDQDNATIALCLQTRSLGLVESLLQVKDRDLTFRFRAESQQACALLRENLDALRTRAFPAQYHVKDMQVGLMETPLNPVNATKAMLDAFGQMPNSAGVDISL